MIQISNSLKYVNSKMAWAERGENKIDYYGVGDLVLEMRAKGFSYMRIARELGSTYSDKMQGDTVSMITVKRWCATHIKEEWDVDGTTVVNAYKENVRMLNMVDNNIEMLNVFLDAVSEMIAEGASNDTILKLFRSTKDLQIELEHYIARNQDIVKGIFNLQKEIFNMQNMSEIIRIIMNTVKKNSPEIYNQIVDELRHNPKFVEAVKRIDDSPIDVTPLRREKAEKKPKKSKKS